MIPPYSRFVHHGTSRDKIRTDCSRSDRHSHVFDTSFTQVYAKLRPESPPELVLRLVVLTDHVKILPSGTKLRVKKSRSVKNVRGGDTDGKETRC